MGKTSKPVRILVLDADLFNSAEVQGLKEKGHPIEFAGGTGDLGGGVVSLHDYDLIIGRRAWYMDTKHLPYLEKIAIPAVRKRMDNREKERQ